MDRKGAWLPDPGRGVVLRRDEAVVMVADVERLADVVVLADVPLDAGVVEQAGDQLWRTVVAWGEAIEGRPGTLHGALRAVHHPEASQAVLAIAAVESRDVVVLVDIVLPLEPAVPHHRQRELEEERIALGGDQLARVTVSVLEDRAFHRAERRPGLLQTAVGAAGTTLRFRAAEGLGRARPADWLLVHDFAATAGMRVRSCELGGPLLVRAGGAWRQA